MKAALTLLATMIAACGRLGFDLHTNAVGQNPVYPEQFPDDGIPLEDLGSASGIIQLQPFRLTFKNSLGLFTQSASLSLGMGMDDPFGDRAIWMTGWQRGTVSKIDQRTGREIARYPSVRPPAQLEDGSLSWSTWNTSAFLCFFVGNTANCPRAAAVDQNLNAYIVNHANLAQGTLTKIANRPEDCIDRNENGVIDTSKDVGDAGIDPNVSGEFFEDDECILWTKAIGSIDARPSASAIAPAGVGGIEDVWVNFERSSSVCRYSAQTGDLKDCLSTDPDGDGPLTWLPYSLTTGSDGRIYVGGRGNTKRPLGYIDLSTRALILGPTAEPVSEYAGQAQEMKIDALGRVWYLTYVGGKGLVYWNPWDQRFTAVDIAQHKGTGDVQTLAIDEQTVWLPELFRTTLVGGDRLYRVDISSASVTTDFFANSFYQTSAAVTYDGKAIIASVGLAEVRVFDTNDANAGWQVIDVLKQASPDSRGDISGYGLNWHGARAGVGRFRYSGCDSALWERVEVRAEIPNGTSFELRFRSNDELGTLGSQPWVGPFTGESIDLSARPGPLPRGKYLEVEVRMARAPYIKLRPRIDTVRVTMTCE